MFLAWLVCAFGPAAGAAPVRFDNAAEYEGRFVEANIGEGTFSWSNAPGVGGTPGRVDVAVAQRTQSTALHRTGFDLSGGTPHHVSTFFLAGQTPPRVGVASQLGFSPRTDYGFYGGLPWVALAVRGGESETLDYGSNYGLVASYVAEVSAGEDADDATPPAEAFALLSGHWYRLGTEWTYAAGGEFRYAATLTDYGTDGVTPDLSAVRSVAGSLVNSAFSDPASVNSMFAGFRGYNFTAGPTLAWDDFEARPVPEPAAPALAAAATASLLLSRRRR